MNGKKAKLARRYAERLTVGKPSVDYTGGGRDKNTGKQVPIKLNDCTRQAYRQLKKLPKVILNMVRDADISYKEIMAKYA